MYSMIVSYRRIISIFFLFFLSFSALAQPVNELPLKKVIKAYKVITSGKQITIKSTSEIKDVMLWTSGGNRLVEQREINNTIFSFSIPINGKFFFLMISLKNGKVYTEKIGIQ